MLADVSGCPNLSREPCSVSNAGSELYQGWWHCRKISTSPHNDITQPIIIFPEFLLDHSIIMSTVYIYIYTALYMYFMFTSCSVQLSLPRKNYIWFFISWAATQSLTELPRGFPWHRNGWWRWSDPLRWFPVKMHPRNHPNGSNWRFFRTLKPQHS